MVSSKCHERRCRGWILGQSQLGGSDSFPTGWSHPWALGTAAECRTS